MTSYDLFILFAPFTALFVIMAIGFGIAEMITYKNSVEHD